MAQKTRHITLPDGLKCDQSAFDELLLADQLIFEVPDTYLVASNRWDGLPEVVCIQRAIALATKCNELTVYWNEKVGRTVLASPGIFPLLAVVLCLENVTHLDAVSGADMLVASSRKEIYEYRFKADLFSDIQILLCSDNRGYGRPKSLYSTRTGGLIRREDFESMIDLLLSTHKGYSQGDAKAIFFSKAVSTIVAELFENTEIHGRIGVDGKPVAKNGIRGLIFKRVKILRNGEWRRLHEKDAINSADTDEVIGESNEVDALEISVFDAGIGFYCSYTGTPLTADVTINQEWGIVHKCLERHYDTSTYDSRHSHRAMGLYEVLRALQLVSGVLEVRSGRTYGYRTFVPGAFRFQLEPKDSLTRPSMPKPVLLDRNRQFVTIPTQHEQLAGASIRVLIPLI